MTAAVLHPASPASAARGDIQHRPDLDAWWQWLNRSGQPASAPHANCSGRVLLISYQFPPTGGSGVQRPAKLAKYLRDYGWTAEVLTAAHDRFPWRDSSLLADLPRDVVIHRIAGREPACVAQWLASPCASIGGRQLGRRINDALHWRLSGWAERIGVDGECLWAGPAARAALRNHRQAPYDAVISTGPPHFAHRVAMRMSQAAGIPWLADLRDPLVSDFDRSACSQRRERRNRRFEAEILHQADAVITTCPSFAWDLRDRYPERAAHITAITNGFDREDLLACLRRDELAAGADECVFVAAGAFYGRRELARIIRPLESLLGVHRGWQNRVRLVIAGTIDAEQQRSLHGLPGWVSIVGYKSHAEALRITAQAACGIVVVPACEHGHLSIPGKTFELLALPIHLLALVPQGSDTENLVSRAGGCTVAPFENENAVTSAMYGIIKAHLAGRPGLDRDWQRVDAFDRRVIARRFADCLNSISSKSCGPASPSRIRTAAEVAR